MEHAGRSLRDGTSTENSFAPSRKWLCGYSASVSGGCTSSTDHLPVCSTRT